MVRNGEWKVDVIVDVDVDRGATVLATRLCPSVSPAKRKRSVGCGAGSCEPCRTIVRSHPYGHQMIIGILTVIPAELRMLLHALEMQEAARVKHSSGTIYYSTEITDANQLYSSTVIVSCFGVAGNYTSSVATAEMIAHYRPDLIILCGIAAGIRGRTRIGDVVLSQGILGYESGTSTSNGEQLRPEGGAIDHSTAQDVANYLARASFKEVEIIKCKIYSDHPVPPVGRETEYQDHVSAEMTIHQGVIASGEKLLRDPRKLIALRDGYHGKIEAGEMEAIGFYTACQYARTRFLVVRGISDFGDSLKNDLFHKLAAAAASAVTANFVRWCISNATDTQLISANQVPDPDLASIRTDLHRQLHLPQMPIRRAIPDRLKRVEERLRSLCDRADYLSRAVDAALEAHDIPRYNRSRIDQASTAGEIQNAIIAYTAIYLDALPRGEASSFEIRFTDSRPLFGALRMEEWLGNSSYLTSLNDLTATAASRLSERGLISRSFIVNSFSELMSDPALLEVLRSVIRLHLERGITTSLVSLSRLEDWGLDAANFCVYKDGLMMTLDLGASAQLRVFEANKNRDDIKVIHALLGQDGPGVIQIKDLAELGRVHTTDTVFC
jgi:nucleoside phosphorylase